MCFGQNEKEEDVQTADNARIALTINEIINKLNEMQEPYKEASASAMKERMDQVEEVINKLAKDLSNNRQYTTSKYYELRQLYEDLADKFGQLRDMAGTTYVRWGRKICPTGTESVYTGYAGGSSKGGAASMLCFPMDPQWLEHSDGASPYGGLVYVAEYEPNSRLLQFFGKDLGQLNVPCSVCNKKQRSSTIMIPGKTRCHAGWNMEYSGYLMSGFYAHIAAPDYYCVDKYAEALSGGKTNDDGYLLYFVELACVVCSK